MIGSKMAPVRGKPPSTAWIGSMPLWRGASRVAFEVLAARRNEVGDLPVERDLAARAEGVGVEQDGHAPLAVAVEHAANAAAVVGVAVAEDERLDVVEAQLEGIQVVQHAVGRDA